MIRQIDIPSILVRWDQIACRCWRERISGAFRIWHAARPSFSQLKFLGQLIPPSLPDMGIDIMTCKMITVYEVILSLSLDQEILAMDILLGLGVFTLCKLTPWRLKCTYMARNIQLPS